jgi:opacity protein-like surface antigen
MRRDYLFGIGMLASVTVGTGSALAADLPVRPAPPIAAPATCCAVPDWAGFYVGIHGGGGWGHESFDSSESFFFQNQKKMDDPVFPFTTPPGASPKGGVFGFQFGHNWQWGPVVGGLEIDFSGADLHESTNFVSPFLLSSRFIDTFTRDKKIDELASARGRLGYLILPNWLIYGTAGIGWGHERINTTASFAPEGVLLASASQSSELSMFGWVAGAGLEWKFWPGSNSWLLRAEWLHYDFGRVTDPNNNFFLNTFPFQLDNGNVRTTVDVARAAISYKF